MTADILKINDYKNFNTFTVLIFFIVLISLEYVRRDNNRIAIYICFFKKKGLQTYYNT